MERVSGDAFQTVPRTAYRPVFGSQAGARRQNAAMGPCPKETCCNTPTPSATSSRSATPVRSCPTASTAPRNCGSMPMGTFTPCGAPPCLIRSPSAALRNWSTAGSWIPPALSDRTATLAPCLSAKRAAAEVRSCWPPPLRTSGGQGHRELLAQLTGVIHFDQDV